METNYLGTRVSLQEDDTQLTRSMTKMYNSPEQDNVMNKCVQLRMEGLKLLVRNQTNVNLLDILRAPPISIKLQKNQKQTFFKTREATKKFALQINEAIQINQAVKPTQSFLIRETNKFQKYINTNLLDVLKQPDAEFKLLVPQIKTQLTIFDSFLTQQKSVTSGDRLDSLQNSSMQDQDQDLGKELYKSPGKIEFPDELKSPSNYNDASNVSHITNSVAKKNSFKIRQVNQTQMLASVNSSHYASPRQSIQINVVHTSKLEKSINVEGNSKLNDYTIEGYLGQGAFGKVKLAQNSNGEQFAIKIANKSKLKRKMLSMKSSAYSLLDREIAIMKKIHHPHVVQLSEVIDDPAQDKLYLVMEYMARGSILSKTFFKSRESAQEMILEELKDQGKIKQTLSPDESVYFFRQFILGLDYLHNYVGVIHRDIKPDNLLVSVDKVLKIADFGVSHIMENEDATISSQQGTQAFLAPEAWGGKNFDGKAVDIWAGGVTLYQFIYNRLPFPSISTVQLKQQILTLNPDFPNQAGYSNEAIQLVRSLLNKDPNQRAKMQQIMSDPWLTDHGNYPLIQIPQLFEEITDVEIKQAITKLNMKMALLTATRMLSKVRKSRISLSNKAALLLLNQ